MSIQMEPVPVWAWRPQKSVVRRTTLPRFLTNVSFACTVSGPVTASSSLGLRFSLGG